MAAKYCVGVPNFGPPPDRLGLADMSVLIEEAGFDGVWVTDHIVLLEQHESTYPYSPDGEFILPAKADWYESVTVLAHLAARTQRVELGIGVLVLPLRNPVVLAKQLATVDRLSGGRLQLAVGSGWLREEVAALGVDPRTRGARTDAAIDVLRTCWTGTPVPGRYGPFEMQPGVRCNPVPVRGHIPIHVGGNSERARRRAGERGDGWFVAGSYDHGPDPRVLADQITEFQRQTMRDSQVSLRLDVPPRALGTADLSGLIGRFEALGVDRFVFDFGWRSHEDARERLLQLRQSVQCRD